VTVQDHELEKHFDHKLIAAAGTALNDGLNALIELDITNVDQAVGTMLGNELTKRFGAEGLPDGTIDIRLRGSAGQSFGAFVPRGIKLTLEGDSNDYVGKGLSGGTIVIRPDQRSIFAAEDNIIAGNVIGYGATSGTMLLRGIVGERFLVRNSGVNAVVEGVGDHALEYMTGGCAVILGQVGRNLGAGMSGGVAYVYKLRADRINAEALKAGELHIGDLEAIDESRLKNMLEQHLNETGSAVAERILANFEIEVKNFVRVLPSDYAAVLSIRSRAEQNGVDPDHESVWKEILEVTNG
jgi:glutamate synthase (NADPH/NADH) large chain